MRSSPHRARLRRSLAFYGFESLVQMPIKKPHLWCGFLLAEDEGFEPPQTESESGVLPLHKSSVRGTVVLYPIFWKCQEDFLIFCFFLFGGGPYRARYDETDGKEMQSAKCEIVGATIGRPKNLTNLSPDGSAPNVGEGF